MKLFKTRNEVKQLRKEVEYLTEMLKIHFDIKTTMKDFSTWQNRHPNASTIPVAEGEWWHYGSIMSRSGEDTATPATLMYRNKKLEIK